MSDAISAPVSVPVLVQGSRQWIYLNRCAHPKATLLFIHGGPGWSDAPWAGKVCNSLWGSVDTVHWDQRGTNRSYLGSNTLPSQRLTIDQMVRDGLEVCQILQKEYQISRPVLVGHSWGTFLAALMASKEPELFSSFVGIGQLVANRESEPISMAFCKRRAEEKGREDLLNELNQMPEDFYRFVPLLFRQREIVSELGGEFSTPVDQNLMEKWMLESPKEYRAEWATLYQSCKTTCEDLWPELIERSLLDEVLRIEIPVTLLQGRHDYCTPGAPVEKWLKKLSCPGRKELIWFDQSAHWPQIEENRKFCETVLQNCV